MSSTKLSQPRENFVLAIFSGLNQRKAYHKAYPSSVDWKVENADSKASLLMKDAKVMARLQELRDEVAEKVIYTKEFLMDKFYNIYEKSSQAVPVMEYDRELEMMVPTGEWKYDSNGANKALTEIGKLNGHYIERVQLSGELDLKAIALRRHEERQAEKIDE